MRKEWSSRWNASAQPRKQRKYKHNAPLHARRKALSVNLSRPLRERFGRRSMVVRKGDEVAVMRGSLRGRSGQVERVSISREKVYIEGVKVKKVDGSEVPKPFVPSNLQITKLTLEDKRRQAVLERAGSGQKKAVKKETKGE
jgi:large subunit ribosomal protein L24